jgi:hypothetical protein
MTSVTVLLLGLLKLIIFRCPNTSDRSKSGRGTSSVKEWASVYLKAAQDRLQMQIDGYTFTIEDMYIMQQMCAYEVGFANHLHRQNPMTLL